MQEIKWYIFVMNPGEDRTILYDINDIDMEKLKIKVECGNKMLDDDRFDRAGSHFIIYNELLNDIIDDYSKYGITKLNFIDLAEYFFKEHYSNWIKNANWDDIELTVEHKDLFKQLYFDIVHSKLTTNMIKTIYNNTVNYISMDGSINETKLYVIIYALDALKSILNSKYDIETKDDKSSEEDKMIAEYIENYMEQDNKGKKWVADKCNIKYKTFIDKLKRGSFTAYELMKMVEVLNIDYHKFSKEILKERSGARKMIVLKCDLCGADLIMDKYKNESTNRTEIIFYCSNPECEASDEQEGCIPFESIDVENIKEI